VDISSGYYFETGATVYWKTVLTGHVTGRAETSGSFVVTAETPPFWSKGGDPAKVVHVWSAAQGDNDGTSWRHAYRNLADALTALAGDAGKTEVWLYGETYPVTTTLSLSRPVAVYGGFDATENAVSERKGVLKTVLDGDETVQILSVDTATGTTSFDRLTFWRGQPRAIEKTGAGDLRLSNVILLENGPGKCITGRGLKMTGGGSAHLTVANCLFRRNAVTVVDDNHTQSEGGAALYLSGLASATVTDCDFLQNGFVTGVGVLSGRDCTYGSIVYAYGSPTVFERCRFAGNGTMLHGSGGGLYFVGASGGSALRNCTFAGNFGARLSHVSDYGNVVSVNLANKTDRLSVTNCTFAYNVSSCGYTAGILGLAGTVGVRNSIFYGNVVSEQYGTNADVCVRHANAVVNASYVQFTDETTCGCSAGTLALSNAFFGDPLFVTSASAFLADYLVTGGAVKAIPKSSYPCYVNYAADFTALNVHLKSSVGWTNERTGELVRTPKEGGARVFSPAVDRGDPASDFSREPAPNGRRINLGAYGNTPYASMSRLTGLSVIVK